MSHSFNYLNLVKQQSLKSEIICTDIETMNRNLSNGNDEYILYLNIRSLNSNFPKLEILIRSLSTKPYYIVCAESWYVQHVNFFKIVGYKMYYNESILNRVDGLVVYIKDDIMENTEIIEIDRLKIIS